MFRSQQLPKFLKCTFSGGFERIVSILSAGVLGAQNEALSCIEFLMVFVTRCEEQHCGGTRAVTVKNHK